MADALVCYGGRRPAVAILLLLLVAAFSLAPLVLLVASSFSESSILVYPPRGFTWEHYRSVLLDSDWQLTALRTLLLTTAGAVVGVPTGIWLGSLRTKATTFAALTHSVFLIPILLPAPVAAIGWYALTLGAFSPPPVFILIAAYATRSLAVAFLGSAWVERQVPRAKLEAAATLGAQPLRIFVRVWLPEAWRHLLAVAVIATLLNLDDILLAEYLLPAHLMTLSRKVYLGVRLSLNPDVAAAAAIIIFMLFGIAMIVVMHAARAARQRIASPV